MLGAPIVVTPPEGDIIEPAKMRLFLRIDGTDLDDEIPGYVAAVAGDIERMTSTRFQEQIVEIHADSFADLLSLNIGPVKGIVSVQYRDRGGAEVTIDAGSYELIGSGLAMGIRPVPGASWPTRWPADVRVRLQVGYGEDLPPALSLALKEAVRARFDGTAYDLFAATVNDRIWL